MKPVPEIFKSALAGAGSFIRGLPAKAGRISPRQALSWVKSAFTNVRAWFSNEKNMDRVLTALKYSAGGLFLFLAFLYMLFPYDALKNRLIEQLERRSGLYIELEKLSPDFFTGIAFKNLRVMKESLSDAPIVSVDEGRARLGLLSLFRKKKALSFSAKLYGGKMKGDVAMAGNVIDLKADWENLHLERYVFPGNQFNLNLGGQVNGNIEFSGDRLRILDGKGTFKLEGAGISVAETTLMGFIKIPATSFKRVEARLNIDSGKLGIPQIELTGDDLSLAVSGMISPDKAAFKNSSMSLKIKVKPGLALAEDFGRFLSTAQAFYPALAGMKADSQGFYTFGVSGTIASPSLLDLSK